MGCETRPVPDCGQPASTAASVIVAVRPLSTVLLPATSRSCYPRRRSVRRASATRVRVQVQLAPEACPEASEPGRGDHRGVVGGQRQAGQEHGQLALGAASTASARSRLLAETPPAIPTLRASNHSAAWNVRSRSVSTTTRWKLAQMSSISRGSRSGVRRARPRSRPLARAAQRLRRTREGRNAAVAANPAEAGSRGSSTNAALRCLTWRMTAVLSPLKLKSVLNLSAWANGPSTPVGGPGTRSGCVRRVTGSATARSFPCFARRSTIGPPG